MALTREVLVHELRQLGVPAGKPLIVHASMRKLGPIAGGAGTLLEALLECLGPQGTLLFPLGSEEDAPFDAKTSPAERDLGVLPEIFRRWPGVSVSDHVAGRFGALGAEAAALLEPMPLHDYYGPGTLLDRFTAQGGSVLRLGADLDTVTLTHWAEYLADVPGKRRVRRRYLRADLGEQWIESLDDTNGIFDWPEGDYFSRILLDFLAAGQARSGTVGNCRAELLPAQPFVTFAVAWLEERFGPR